MDLERIGEGRLAEIFVWDDDRVVKLYRTPSADWLANEASATEAVFAAGAPAARFHGIVEVGGRTGLILDRLTGPVVGELMFGGSADRAMEALGALHARIHERRGDGFESLRARVERRIAASLDPATADEVLERMKSLPDGDSVLHTDLHPYNAMRNGEEWVAIDWNGAFRGPPGYDVARTRFLLRHASYIEPGFDGATDEFRKRAADRYLAAYVQHRPLDTDELERWRLPVLAARLAENIEEERRFLRTTIHHLLKS